MKGNKMEEYEKYKIAMAKAKEVEKMPLSEEKKSEIYSNLGQYVNDKEKGLEEMPFPFGKKPRKI